MTKLIMALAIFSAIIIFQTPKAWLKKPLLWIPVAIFNALGIAGLVLLLFFDYRLGDGFLREATVWSVTVYVACAEFALFLSFFRYFVFEVARHFKVRWLITILDSGVAFYLSIMLVTGLYLVSSTYNATNLQNAYYDISVNKECSDEKLTIVNIADMHVGAGAGHSELDQMVELVNEAKPDIVIIAGDICDSASSVSDLKYLETSLKAIDSRLGIFMAEGNHEADCRIDYLPYMTGAGVVVLKDEGVVLENGVNIIGRSDKSEVPVDEENYEMDLENPTIVIQHRANNLQYYDGRADLVLCGHTHGYQFPFDAIYGPFTRDMTYGYGQYGDVYVVVTSGVSQWGYRCKWPSRSEVAVIRVHFAAKASGFENNGEVK